MRILLLLFLLVTSNVYALEITDFRLNIINYFMVTVALDDLDSGATVTCTIYYDGKPIARQSDYINGVGTMEIRNPAGITGEGLTVRCE